MPECQNQAMPKEIIPYKHVTSPVNSRIKQMQVHVTLQTRDFHVPGFECGTGREVEMSIVGAVLGLPRCSHLRHSRGSLPAPHGAPPVVLRRWRPAFGVHSASHVGSHRGAGDDDCVVRPHSIVPRGHPAGSRHHSRLPPRSRPVAG